MKKGKTVKTVKTDKTVKILKTVKKGKTVKTVTVTVGPPLLMHHTAHLSSGRAFGLSTHSHAPAQPDDQLSLQSPISQEKLTLPEAGRMEGLRSPKHVQKPHDIRESFWTLYHHARACYRARKHARHSSGNVMAFQSKSSRFQSTSQRIISEC